MKEAENINEDLTGLIHSNGFNRYVDILKEFWKVEDCNSGGCYCQEVILIKDSNIRVYPSAILPKRLAEHIVEIHNNQLKEKSCDISSLKNSNSKLKQGIKDHISQLIDGGTQEDSLIIVSLKELMK